MDDREYRELADNNVGLGLRPAQRERLVGMLAEDIRRFCETWPEKLRKHSPQESEAPIHTPSKVETLSEHVRSNYYVSLICNGCDRSVVNWPSDLKALKDRLGDITVKDLARRFKCKECGHKGARISSGYCLKSGR